MSFKATLYYPADAKVDLKYCKEKHMALVMEKMRPSGMKGWTMLELGEGPDGMRPYSVQTISEWESEEAFKKWMGSNGMEAIMADVKNFSDQSPTMFISGKVDGEGK